MLRALCLLLALRASSAAESSYKELFDEDNAGLTTLEKKSIRSAATAVTLAQRMASAGSSAGSPVGSPRIGNGHGANGNGLATPAASGKSARTHE